MDPTTVPSSREEIVLGGEYVILKDIRLGLTYSHRWLYKWIEDMSHDNRESYFIGNPGSGLASDFPKAARDYDAATLYFMKTFSDEWLMSASYTLSYLRGNINGLFSQNGELDPNHNFDFDTKTITTNTYGPLPGDHTHDIKIFGAKGLEVPLEGERPHDRSRVPREVGLADRLLGRRRRVRIGDLRALAARLRRAHPLDLRHRREPGLSLPDSTRTGPLGLSMDIFNIFDFQSVTQRGRELHVCIHVSPSATGKLGATRPGLSRHDKNGTSLPPRPINTSRTRTPNFGAPTSYQTPRQFRFGIKGTF